MSLSVDIIAGNPFTGQLLVIMDIVVELIRVILLLDNTIDTLGMDVQIYLGYSVHRFLRVFSAYLRVIFDSFRIHSSVIYVYKLVIFRSTSCCSAGLRHRLFLNLSHVF